MAKFLTLNTHSWMEEEPEQKLADLVQQIVREDYDVICLQEVNQEINSSPAEEWVFKVKNFAIFSLF